MDLTLFTSWMDQQQAYNTKTVQMYERMVRQFLSWLNSKGFSCNEIRNLDEISSGQVRNYRSYLLEKRELKASTTNKAVQAIRIFGRWACENGFMHSNPALKVSYIEEPMLAPKSLEPEKASALRDFIAGKSLKIQVMIELGLSAGLRVSEVVALKIKDISLVRGGGEIRIRCGKGYKYRTVPISKELASLLKRYLASRTSESDYVLVSERQDRKMTARAIQKVVQKIRSELGFYLTFHALRHTFCADLLKSGTQLTDVAVMAGHFKKNGMPNIATTARYVLSRPDELAQAVQDMERWRQRPSGATKRKRTKKY